MNKIKNIGLNLVVISALSMGFSGCGSEDNSSGEMSENFIDRYYNEITAEKAKELYLSIKKIT